MFRLGLSGISVDHFVASGHTEITVGCVVRLNKVQQMIFKQRERCHIAPVSYIPFSSHMKVSSLVLPTEQN